MLPLKPGDQNTVYLGEKQRKRQDGWVGGLVGGGGGGGGVTTETKTLGCTSVRSQTQLALTH